MRCIYLVVAASMLLAPTVSAAGLGGQHKRLDVNMEQEGERFPDDLRRPGVDAEVTKKDEVIAGEFIIGLSDRAGTAAPLSSVAARFGSGFNVHVTKAFHVGKFKALHAEAENLEVARKLLTLPEVDFVEPNKVVWATDACVEQISGTNFWGLSRIERRTTISVNDTEDQLTYSTSTDSDGAGVDVFVFDTGIRTTHQEFGGRARWGMTASGINETEDDFNAHGTHVAGTAGGATTGVAKRANLVALKVLDRTGRGSTAGILEAIEWTINDVETSYTATGRRPKVVCNLSLGYGGRSLSADRGVVEAAEAGLTMVLAAGNSADDACRYSPHAGYSVRVAASNINDNLAWFSNWGPCVDITAPGRYINSSYISSDDAYAVLSGTSMAAPHVAGAVARYLSSVQEAPSPHVVKAWLIDTATRGAIQFQDYQDENTTLLQSSTPNRLLFVNCSALPPSSDGPPQAECRLPTTEATTVTLPTQPPTTQPPTTVGEISSAPKTLLSMLYILASIVIAMVT